jgi:hypothetical protein
VQAAQLQLANKALKAKGELLEAKAALKQNKTAATVQGASFATLKLEDLTKKVSRLQHRVLA